ncbi:hypothetical protein CWI36_0094p0040 [Hamiltosporidium magnivora]|uniref:Uncharacterized protein n=1 Tax=Hamiltosporidium magnivora TaxID=148818 RepID=A0A4Q9LKM6_9MICR|nr:hypothetical protein CWI36_0094p0040 [Hamiltosporidium magnivora]
MIHLWLGCKERLYFSITELERGLHSVEQAATLNVENSNKTHLALIKCFLKVKYRLEEEVPKKNLEESQFAKLYIK